MSHNSQANHGVGKIGDWIRFFLSNMENVLYCAETELCKQCTKTGKVLEKERKIFRLYIILCVLQGHVLCRAGPGRGSEAYDEGVRRIHTDDGAADDGGRARSV